MALVNLAFNGDVYGDMAVAGCHVMAKPGGAICNVSCRTYCFYLEKRRAVPGTP